MLDLDDRLDELKELGLYRRTRMVSGPQGPRVVLDGGRVVDRGCHEDLLGRGGLYAQLYRSHAEAVEA